MARFSEGDDHARRRAIAESRLALVSVDDSRREARQRAGALLIGRRELDVMAHLARPVPIAVLAAALGATDIDGAVAATRRLCLALAPPIGHEPADGWDEVATLASLLGVGAAPTSEEAVNIVALLFQAMDATAGYIGNALDGHRATVTCTFRVAPDGVPHAVDLDTAEHSLQFGFGHHKCPGESHARALAAGVIDALAAAGAILVQDDTAYEARANLRIPAHRIMRRA